MGVSENSAYPQIIHFIRVSIINHPFWGKHRYFWKHPYAWSWDFGNKFRQVVRSSLSFLLLSGPAAGMTPEEEADQVLRQVVGGP